MLRIVIDAREYSTSTGYYIKKLIQYLKNVDKENEYLVLLKPEDLQKFEETVNFKKVESPYKEYTFAEQFGLKKQLKKLKPDLVHFGMVQQPILYRGKTVTTMHDLTTCRFKNPAKNSFVFWIKQQIYKFVNWYVPRKSKFIITPTEHVKKDVVGFAKINPKKIIVIHEATDEILEPAEPIKKLRDKQFILYVGRPQPHKNLSRLVEVFSKLKEDYPDLLLVLAGKKDKVYDSYIDPAKNLGIDINKNIVFPGWITDGQKKWLMRSCRAYVFPSLSEGFGLPGLEAMLHRAPVVSSNATCLPEVYGDAAWYFNPLDIHDMTTSISEVLDNKELRNKLIRQGREQVKKYSWEKMAKETLRVYEAALRD